jgi:hypothetical protein
MFENSVNIQGNSAVSLSVSGTGAQTPARLSPGVYDVWCDVDVFIKVNQVLASDVTTANGYKIVAGNIVPVQITSDSFLGAIAGGAGTLKYHKVG